MLKSNLILITIILLLSNIIFSQCPRGIDNCKGQCGRFVDDNNDGYCDLTVITENIKPVIKDTIKKVEVLKQKTSKIAKVDNKIKKEIVTKIDSSKIEKEVIIVKKDSILNESKIEKEIPLQKNDKVYDFISISIFTLLAYLFTYLLYKFKKIKLITHRRIWNILLLITFLVSGLLGLFLVVQINYNFVMDWYRSFLYWHVEFGIAMGIISIFHVIWHFNYYRNCLKLKKCDENDLKK